MIKKKRIHQPVKQHRFYKRPFRQSVLRQRTTSIYPGTVMYRGESPVTLISLPTDEIVISERESSAFFPKSRSLSWKIKKRIEDIQSFRRREMQQEIEALRAKLAESESKCRDFDATVILLQRAEREWTDEKLRLLKLLRKPLSGELLQAAYRLGQLSTVKETTNFKSLRVAVELCELGQMEYQEGAFCLTPKGKKLVKELQLT